jgi:hypothetical protein
LRLKDARPLDELAHDLPSQYVLNDDTLDAPRVHPIIQRCHPARARQGRKPGSEARLGVGDDLANEHVGALRAATKAALPDELGLLARMVSFERGAKDLVQLTRGAAVTALGPATDDNLETTSQRPDRTRER